MKQERKWLRMVMPLMALAFLSFAQVSFAQDDNYQNNDNSGNYNNGDEELIQPENDVNYNTFHDELSPYGSWRDYPGYGNVWVCNVAGFSPYNTGGHWAYSRFGWTWVSDYNWGWAPFHYGRWGYDASYGYFWVPGYTWGPAWVSWRNGGDYYGWAPLSPGLNVNINVGVGIGAASWIFLPHRYMGYRNSYNYYAPRQQNVTIIRNTTIINNTHVYNNNRFATGPDRRQVERYSGQRVQQQNIYVSNNRNKNHQDANGIHMFHPNVNRGVVNNNNRNGVQNGQPVNRSVQDNVRQQPVNGLTPNRNHQPNNGAGGTTDNRPANRFQQRSGDRAQQGVDRNNNGNGILNDAQRRQQSEQIRQQQAQQQQQTEQRQQQMNDRREQMQQQMEQRRQERDAQQQQVQQQQRQDQVQQQRQQQTQQRQQQMDQQRQQMQQQRQQQMQQRDQRQQQFQQRNQNTNRPATQNGGGRKGRNS